MAVCLLVLAAPRLSDGLHDREGRLADGLHDREGIGRCAQAHDPSAELLAAGWHAASRATKAADAPEGRHQSPEMIEGGPRTLRASADPECEFPRMPPPAGWLRVPRERRRPPAVAHECSGRWVGFRLNLDPEGSEAMAETKTKRTGAPTAATKAAATRRAAVTSVDRSTELSGEVLQSVEDAQRAVIEVVHKFVDTAESLPLELADEFVDLLGHLARIEYDTLRSIVHSAVNVDVNVNVDVLSEGVHVDVLSGGVNVDVLSGEGT